MQSYQLWRIDFSRFAQKTGLFCEVSIICRLTVVWIKKGNQIKSRGIRQRKQTATQGIVGRHNLNKQLWPGAEIGYHPRPPPPNYCKTPRVSWLGAYWCECK